MEIIIDLNHAELKALHAHLGRTTMGEVHGPDYENATKAIRKMFIAIGDTIGKAEGVMHLED